MIQVIARDTSLNRLGPLPYISLQVALRHLGVSAWSLTMDSQHLKAGLVTAGGGVIIEDDQAGTLLSGPVRVINKQADDDGPEKTLTLTGVSDEFRLATRLVYPDPAHIATNQGALEADVRAGVAETVMKGLVNLNAGPGALVARRTAGLTLAADSARGSSVKSSARFDNLLDVLVTLGSSAGLGFSVIQVGTGLVFDVYEPQDRSATARFSRALGNLRGYSYELSGPTATTAVVAGQGEGVLRTFVERINTAAETDWAERDEVFVDRRDTNDAATLQQAGDDALFDHGPGAALTITPIDTPLMRYGVDYGRGDTVTVEVDGALLVDVVQQVNIEVTGEDHTVQPIVGTVGAGVQGNPRIFQQVSDLARRIGLIERRK